MRWKIFWLLALVQMVRNIKAGFRFAGLTLCNLVANLLISHIESIRSNEWNLFETPSFLCSTRPAFVAIMLLGAIFIRLLSLQTPLGLLVLSECPLGSLDLHPAVLAGR